jgi:flagellin
MAVMSLQTNTASLAGQRALKRVQYDLQHASSMLSSGHAINSAQDDAAGLGVAERLRAQVRGLAQASRNVNVGISIIQTAEGVMSEISDIVIRLRELAVHSASDSVTDTERAYIDTEYQELRSEIDRMVASTKFNGEKLLDGSYTGKEFRVTSESGGGSIVSVSISNVNTAGLSINITDVINKANAQNALSTLDSALDTLSSARTSIGAKANQLLSAANAGQVMRENLASAESRIRDTDIAWATSQFARQQVLNSASVAMLAQANATPKHALKLLS